MAIKDEINKPTISIVFVDSGTTEPQHCYFDVEITFKPINGIVPYPPLKYPSDRYEVKSAQMKKQEILEVMLGKAKRHKKIHDFLNSQKLILETFLTQEFA